MEIIQASFIDLVDVIYLLKQCVLDMNRKGLKQWNMAHPSTEIIKQDIEKGTLYLYSETKIVQGMINLSEEVPDEYKEISWKGSSGKALYIKRLAIHPLWIESEVAVNLIAFAENYARKNNFTSIRIDLLDSYPVGEKFFTSNSFIIAGDFHSEDQKLPFVCFEKNL